LEIDHPSPDKRRNRCIRPAREDGGMPTHIIPLGFPARVSYADEDGRERNGTAFAFECDPGDRLVLGWVVAAQPQLDATTVYVPADRMKRLPGLHT
jgi:hypothetical protein